jgi:hypothetical protein
MTKAREENQKAVMNHKHGTNSQRLTPGTPANYAREMVESLIPRPKIAREGWLRSGVLLGAGLLARSLSSKLSWLRPVGNILTGLGFLTAFAYRDPERNSVGQAADFVYAPVDGTVLSVTEVADEPRFVGGPAYKIEIASHILDVPVLRIPMPGRVQYMNCPPSLAAGSLGLEIAGGKRLLLDYRPNLETGWRLPASISGPGFLPRIQAGQTLTPIAKIGLRGFGVPLLTTLYFPVEGFYILSQAGFHVQAGMTVIGRAIPE